VETIAANSDVSIVESMNPPSQHHGASQRRLHDKSAAVPRDRLNLNQKAKAERLESSAKRATAGKLLNVVTLSTDDGHCNPYTRSFHGAQFTSCLVATSLRIVDNPKTLFTMQISDVLVTCSKPFTSNKQRWTAMNKSAYCRVQLEATDPCAALAPY